MVDSFSEFSEENNFSMGSINETNISKLAISSGVKTISQFIS